MLTERSVNPEGHDPCVPPFVDMYTMPVGMFAVVRAPLRLLAVVALLAVEADPAEVA